MSCRSPVRFGLTGLTALSACALLVGTPAVAAQTAAPAMPPSVVVAQSADFAAVRARFEDLTPADLAQDGYQIEPVCVTAPMAGAPPELGSMGFHASHPTLLKVQFANGRPDPEQPPIVLLDASQRVGRQLSPVKWCKSGWLGQQS